MVAREPFLRMRKRKWFVMNIIKNIKQFTCGREMACAIACETINFLILSLPRIDYIHTETHSVSNSKLPMQKRDRHYRHHCSDDRKGRWRRSCSHSWSKSQRVGSGCWDLKTCVEKPSQPVVSEIYDRKVSSIMRFGRGSAVDTRAWYTFHSFVIRVVCKMSLMSSSGGSG